MISIITNIATINASFPSFKACIMKEKERYLEECECMWVCVWGEGGDMKMIYSFCCKHVANDIEHSEHFNNDCSIAQWNPNWSEPQVKLKVGGGKKILNKIMISKTICHGKTNVILFCTASHHWFPCPSSFKHSIAMVTSMPCSMWILYTITAYYIHCNRCWRRAGQLMELPRGQHLSKAEWHQPQLGSSILDYSTELTYVNLQNKL